MIQSNSETSGLEVLASSETAVAAGSGMAVAAPFAVADVAGKAGIFELAVVEVIEAENALMNAEAEITAEHSEACSAATEKMKLPCAAGASVFVAVGDGVKWN